MTTILDIIELHREQKGHLHIKSPLSIMELLTNEANTKYAGNRSLLITAILAVHYKLVDQAPE